MATKKTPLNSDLSMEVPGSDADLEQAIDDLRGVLKNDAQGIAPVSDFDADFGAAPAASSFDDDFGAGASATPNFGGSPAFASSTGASAREFTRMQEPGSALTSNLDLIMDIPIDVQIVLGTSRMQVSGLMNLSEGATIALDKKIGEPVDIIVNGRKIARGEITVLESDDTRFGVKLIEVMGAKKA